MITKDDQELIDWLRHAGHGWARFAASVERQGVVSHRQRVTMHAMRHKIENHRLGSDQQQKKADMEPSVMQDTKGIGFQHPWGVSITAVFCVSNVLLWIDAGFWGLPFSLEIIAIVGLCLSAPLVFISTIGCWHYKPMMRAQAGPKVTIWIASIFVAALIAFGVGARSGIDGLGLAGSIIAGMAAVALVAPWLPIWRSLGHQK